MRIVSIKRTNGVAGQIAFDVVIQYPDEEPETHGLIGTAYGEPGPVVAVSPSGTQVFVVDPGRCGSRFNEDWVRAFYANA